MSHWEMDKRQIILLDKQYTALCTTRLVMHGMEYD